MNKLIITCAITGGASPDSNKYLPKTPQEQAQSALDAWRAGASVIHIHARNPATGLVAHETRFFEEAILPIREQSDVIINVSTGGTGRRVDGDWLYTKIPHTSCEERVSVVAELSANPRTLPLSTRGVQSSISITAGPTIFCSSLSWSRVSRICGTWPEGSARLE